MAVGDEEKEAAHLLVDRKQRVRDFLGPRYNLPSTT
jgi:hypothetical protein